MTRVEALGGQGIQIGEHGTQDNKFIQTYIENQVIQPPAVPASGQVVAGEVPQPPPAFQPRADLLAALHQSGPGVSVVRSVTGMRGVGKTQVAAAYARWCIDSGWRLVAWVNAGDTTQVLSGLAVVADRLGIGQRDADLVSRAALVRNRLEADGERCLVVFDNLADLDGVRPFVPAAGKSQVVITSTDMSAAALGRPVPVDAFSEEEALAFLAQRTSRDDDEGARELVQELGYLPLALAQAAAVIVAQRLNYWTYLDRLRSLSVQEYLTPVAGDAYPHGVAQAVLLSLDAAVAADRTGLCAAIIDVVSLLSSAGVPRALLYAAGPAGIYAEAGEEDADDDSQKMERNIDEALGQLAAVSLMTFSVDASTVSAHRLIMRVARERRAHDGTLAAIGARTCVLLSAVIRSLEQPWQNRLVARDTIQQVTALNDHLGPHLGEDHAVVAVALLHLRRWVVKCMDQLGDGAFQAIAYGEQVESECKRILGDTHPDTLTVRGNLAYAYQVAGRLDEVIPLYERTVADCERGQGDTHPDTLTVRTNLAAAYHAAGRLDEAISLYERTVADCERGQGDTHPNTLHSRNNLAYAYRAAGRLDEAISLYERTLADCERVLGDTHPNTLTSRNNLAFVRHAAGRLDEAIPLYERTVADRERVQGDTHPNTLSSRINLAVAYQAAGRLDEAIPLYERTLAECERILGDAHPNTLQSRSYLIAAYEAAGQLEKAGILRGSPPAPGNQAARF